MSSQTQWADVFAEVFAQPPSRVMAEVNREVLGDEYPAALAPYSYTTWTELRRFVVELKVGPGQLLADVGCGHGGPGLWVAATTGADYLGVDINEPALAAVRERAAALELPGQVRAAIGAFERLPVGDAVLDAVMSVDALLFAPDKPAAAAELARAIRPGGRLVLTTWDYSRRPEGRPEQVADHRPLLHEAGFELDAYETTPQWQERQRAMDRLLLERVDELAAESGEDPQDVRAGLLEMAAAVDAMVRRVLVVATRR
jgi:SAM-dependent methyltransferase